MGSQLTATIFEPPARGWRDPTRMSIAEVICVRFALIRQMVQPDKRRRVLKSQGYGRIL